MRAAVIGSFRQHYDDVCAAVATLRTLDIHVTTPKGAEVLEAGIPFVRFRSDPEEWDDPTVQTVALHRILRADAVYVVAPGGYVGRTTCYEVGRVIQADRPIYFSTAPDDLPLAVPEDKIVDPGGFARLLLAGKVTTMFADDPSPYGRLEGRLLTGEYSDS
jgi:hypothetical protein